MNQKESFWDKVAEMMGARRYYVPESLARYKESEFLDILEEWKEHIGDCVYKTDSFEEAFGKERICEWFLSEGAECICGDISREIVKRASKNACSNIRWVVADCQSLPFKGGSLSSVFSSSTFGYADDLKDTLLEVRRVLKTGGHLFFSINNKENLFFRYVLSFAARFTGIPFPMSTFYSRGDVINILENNGYKVKHVSAIVHVLPGMKTFFSIMDRLGLTMLSNRLCLWLKRYGAKDSLAAQRTGWFTFFIAVKR